MAGHHDPVCRPHHPVRRPLQETTLPQQCDVLPSWPRQINRVSMVTNKTLTMMTDRNLNTFSNTSDTFTINNANEKCDYDQVLERDENSNIKGVSDESESVIVSFGKDKRQKKKGSGSSLQDAFLKFRLAKQNVIKRSQLMKERELATKCDPNQMWQLRMKFVERAKTYFGVPYAKKYHQPGTPEYNAPLFLDCCALVRQVLRDLKEDFGFDIGPWNQAYQYDTLPITIEDEKDMKPGDLVFISGIYHSKKSKKQKHNMVHVEIWAGEGAKTIGARWQKGKVQVFDSYRFEAKSYHSMQYYFKSIDTWLQGICKSYCPEHKWISTLYEPGRKSIFSIQQQDANEIGDEGAGDTEDDMIESEEEDDMVTSRQGTSEHGEHLKSEETAGQDVSIKVEPQQEREDGDTTLLKQDGEGRLREAAIELCHVSRKDGTHQDRDEEQRCWEHIETSPVRTLSPQQVQRVSKVEEQCWQGIEAIAKHKKAAEGDSLVCKRNAENNACGHGIGNERSKGCGLASGSERSRGDQPLSASENHKYEMLAEQIVHNIFRSLGIALNEGNHCDFDDKERQSIVATGYCHWSNGDGTEIPLGRVNNLPHSGKVDTLVVVEDIENQVDGSSQICSGGSEETESCHRIVVVDIDYQGKGSCYVCSSEELESCHRIGVCSECTRHENESTIRASCLCTDQDKESDACDNTSLDDYPCCKFSTTTGPWNASTNHAADNDSACIANPSCDRKFHNADSSRHNCGYDTTCGNHGNRVQMCMKADNLCSSDHAKDCPIVEGLTCGCHGGDLFNLEARDGDDNQPQNSGSKGAGPGKPGRKSPGKKAGQKPQRDKDKNQEGDPDPARGGGGGGGSVSRSLPSKELGPAFYIGGGNGVSLVEDPLVAKGWHRIQDRHSDGFKLKWVELKTHINYNNFRPGEQLVNRIPNSHLLATKTGLYNTLKDYDRLCGRTKSKSKGIKMSDFFAESYVLDVKAEREAFFQTFKDGEIWICKPNGMNQGKGIYLVRDLTELKRKYAEKEVKNNRHSARPSVHGSRLIQRYIPNPLLINGKKFDVRTYMLIACTNPFVVLFHTGYLRLACDDYDADSTDLHRHLTNQYQQKKHPSYQDVKEDTVWSMERFNDLVNEMAEDKGLSKDWVMGYFHKQMSKIMVQCFNAVKSKLDCRQGFFDLLGFDFLIDTDFKVWLIEINVNPALHTNCEVLRHLLPGMIEETLDIVLEIHDKNKRNRPIMPLASQRKFVTLHNGGSTGGGGGRVRTAKSTSPTRPNPTRPVGARSSSPPKKVSTSSVKPLSVRQNVTKVTTSKEGAAGAGRVNNGSKDAS